MSLATLIRAGAWIYALLVAYLLWAPLAPAGPAFSISQFLFDPIIQMRDIVENLLLGLPIGFLFALASILSGHRVIAAVLSTSVLVLAVILPIEIAQHWMPTRSSSFLDIILILFGGFASITAVWVCRPTISAIAAPFNQEEDGVQYGLAFIWPLLFCVPNRLQLDRHILSDGILPLAHFSIDAFWINDFLVAITGWLVVIALLPKDRGRWLVGLLLLISWAGLILAPGRALSWGLVSGGVTAILLGQVLRHPTGILTAIGAGAMALLLTQLFQSEPGRQSTIFWIPMSEYAARPILGTVTKVLGENVAWIALPMLFWRHYQTSRSGWVALVFAIAAITGAFETLALLTGRDGHTTPIFFLTVGTILGWYAMSGGPRGGRDLGLRRTQHE